MDTKYILPYLFSRPFEPFFFSTTSGREVLVLTPEFLFFDRNIEAIWVSNPEGQLECFEAANVVSLRTRQRVDPIRFIGTNWKE